MNNLNRGKDCIGQTVIDARGESGTVIDFYRSKGKTSRLKILYDDGSTVDRLKDCVKRQSYVKRCEYDADEEFKNGFVAIPGYNGRYIINQNGVIKVTKGKQPGKILKPYISPQGYTMICLIEYNHRRAKYIHRLMASSFIKPLTRKDMVIHKDGNKQNNGISNLDVVPFRAR